MLIPLEKLTMCQYWTCISIQLKSYLSLPTEILLDSMAIFDQDFFFGLPANSIKELFITTENFTGLDGDPKLSCRGLTAHAFKITLWTS